ncbi:sulfite exporter TauE/SafE family protein [Arsukibacterium indicum]|uniref:Probable membrane transporter protein n=1 Tax=Arsukibacterium indicum TaxID=2848612 RepID=A0ABS6MGP8_9GAMM|nr:sulfite exporter TauE/SafE family protein [Arsukibacterium indicum]MBV2127974.1 sulfite exporter TauE/SafE family protein [Arsukibacterium indicum]
MLTILLVSALIGCLAGFLAGLLGIGGGLVIVPVLVVLLPALGVVGIDDVMVVAVATSLASIIVTSGSSIRAHHKRSNVSWSLAGTVMLGAGVGAGVIGLVAHHINGTTLRIFFGVAVFFLALRMLGSRSVVGRATLPVKPILAAIAALLGAISGLLGIGGGALVVPVLNYFSVEMRRAIGCAAASGIAIAVLGTLGYVIAGWQHYQLTDGFVGYIYLPALIGIVSTSVFTATLGAAMTQRWPVLTIKRIFGVFLMLVAARMVFS